MNRLYLVDSSIYVFLGWFRLPDTLLNTQGEPNNAWIGFSDFVYRLLDMEKPKQLVFAFDESLHQCKRKAIYPEYKANRSPAPEELKRQFRWCREWVSALGFSDVASHDYEADDLIGSLARWNRRDDRAMTFVTADKDLAQLVRENDSWWSFGTGQQLNYRAIHKKFGVKPEQIADQLALAGDKVDNIPGIPGVGMAIAARLLTKFGDLPTLREHLAEVDQLKFRGSARIKQLLIDNQSILDVSAMLTPIFDDIESMKAVEISARTPDVQRVLSMLDLQGIEGRRRDKWIEWMERQQ